MTLHRCRHQRGHAILGRVNVDAAINTPLHCRLVVHESRLHEIERGIGRGLSLPLLPWTVSDAACCDRLAGVAVMPTNYSPSPHSRLAFVLSLRLDIMPQSCVSSGGSQDYSEIDGAHFNRSLSSTVCRTQPPIPARRTQAPGGALPRSIHTQPLAYQRCEDTHYK